MFKSLLEITIENPSDSGLQIKQIKVERAFIYHDMATCSLELENLDEGIDFSEMSFMNAKQAGEVRWCLNSKVLMAQIYGI